MCFVSWCTCGKRKMFCLLLWYLAEPGGGVGVGLHNALKLNCRLKRAATEAKAARFKEHKLRAAFASAL